MSTPSPFGGGNPFGELFRQMSKLFTGTGPVNWEIARQVAASQEAEGGGDGEGGANVDPLERIRLEELIRVAELHVAEATGLEVSQTGRALSVRAVSRTEWAWATLEAWKPLLESLGLALTPSAPSPDETAASGTPDPLGALGGGDLSGLIGGWAKALPPVFLGMQAGSMVGMLAQRVLGQYDLPIPRPRSDELLVVASNLAGFASDWSLPPDDVRLWVCLSEVTHHAVTGRPHVRERLDALLGAFVAGFRPDTAALEARMSQLDLTDMEAIAQALGDPSAILGDMQTPEQRATLQQLEAVTAALEGYVDQVMDRVGHRLISSYPSLTEALRRRRAERGEGERMVGRMLGMELPQGLFDRGSAFAAGVVERAGEGGLARLWADARALPTPAEVDAPGLWLERIDLPAP
ncbi:MAG TPA: zinc-dependent metalloprotease [Acidimicrobiales bacterium]